MKISWKRHKNAKSQAFNRCGELSEAWFQLQSWYQTRLGRMLADEETQRLHHTLSNLFGYQLLQVGRVVDDDCLSNSRVKNCNVMDFPPIDPLKKTGPIQGLPDQLPIQTNSIDVIVLPHVLEFSQHPHQVLREVERVLIPDGHVVMLVFNPYSLWIFWRLLFGWRHRLPWCGRFLSATRVKDWLALLGFELVSLEHYFYRPALQQRRVMSRLTLLDRLGRRLWPIFGASKLVVAKKRAITLTPIGPAWNRKKPKITGQPGLVEPAQRKPNP